MAEEMGVRFLGVVPVDVKFSVLIEGENAHASDSEEEDNRQQEAEQKVPDERPLIEKYADCWSYPRFEGFAKTLISAIEDDTR